VATPTQRRPVVSRATKYTRMTPLMTWSSGAQKSVTAQLIDQHESAHATRPHTHDRTPTYWGLVWALAGKT
jgi:hypothetical protein